MANAPTLPRLREVIERHGLRAKKSLGQHFLLDLNLTDRIARAAGDLSRVTVVEVGPGPGGLTRSLLAAGAREVVAIERDAHCLPALAELAAAYPGRLRVIEGDALEIDPAALVQDPVKIVSNLPYNIATPLLVRWMAQAPRYASLTLMFQKEVAQRLTASPGSKAYGRLSIMVQWRCEAKKLFDVPARAFVPPPKVDSSLVGLTPRGEPLAPAKPEILERVTAAAFGQRRKMLRASLRTLGGNAQELLEDAGIVPTRRAEDLSVEEFCALARALESREGPPPSTGSG